MTLRGSLPAPVTIFSLPKNSQDLADFNWDAFFASTQNKNKLFSVIDGGSYFFGTLLTRSAFIHGHLKGFIIGEHVTVDKTGILDATVFCRKLTVLGHVQGEIFCDIATVKKGGHLNGLLQYKRLHVSTGGIVRGKFEKRHPR